MLQKADTIEAEESVEPPKPEKKKTRKEKKGSASPEDEAGEPGDSDGDRLHGERNGEQKATKKVRNPLMGSLSLLGPSSDRVSSCRTPLPLLPQTVMTMTAAPTLMSKPKRARKDARRPRYLRTRTRT